jgi:hypothetical protein
LNRLQKKAIHSGMRVTDEETMSGDGCYGQVQQDIVG